MKNRNIDLEDVLLESAALGLLEIEGRQLEYESAHMGESKEKPSEESVKKLERKLHGHEQIVSLKKGSMKAGKFLSHAAVLFLVIFIGTSSLFITSADARQIIYELLFSRYERYSQLEPSKTSPEQINNFDTYIQAEAAFAPTYIPERFEVADFIQNGSTKIAVYEDENENYFSFKQTNLSENSVVRFDTENADSIEHIVIGESEALLIKKDGDIQIVWQCDDVALSVLTKLSEDEALQIAKGIVKIK